jgi:hypothetical protein
MIKDGMLRKMIFFKELKKINRKFKLKNLTQKK